MYGFIEKAEKLVPETTNYIDEESDDGSDIELSFTIDEIKDFNDSLFDLVPFLEMVQIGTPNEDPEIQILLNLTSSISNLSSSTILTGLRTEALSYQRNILDKFPKADLELVGIMAELNWLRHERIRDIASMNENAGNPFKQISTQSEIGASTIQTPFQPSEIGASTIQTSFQPSSIFSWSQTCPSAGTSFYEPNQSIGNARYPNPPKKSGPGTSSTCTICFKNLNNISARTQWRYVMANATAFPS